MSNELAAGTDAQGGSEMFDKLIESEPEGARNHNRTRYFTVSLLAMIAVLSSSLIVSIFAADYGLGTGGFELVEMLAPDEVKPVEPEPERPQPATNPNRSTSIPTRVVNMQRVDEPPLAVPDSVSTTRNTHAARPDYGRFDIGPRDTDTAPGNPGDSGRGPGGSGPGTGTLSTGTRPNTSENEPEDAPPPPRVQRPAETKSVIKSLGVVNGIASSLPKPVYSAAAISVKAQGRVDVQVMIDEDGRVVSAKAINGHPLLRPSAEDAARRAKFTPTYLSKVAVKVTGVITYNFIR